MKTNLLTGVQHGELVEIDTQVGFVRGAEVVLRVRVLEKPKPPRPEPELKQVGVSNFYFVGDKGPYCQPCYDGKGKLTMLTPPENWSGGVRRQCVLCGEYFYEKARGTNRERLGGRGGPHGWMG
jgi:hypothetical protein